MALRSEKATKYVFVTGGVLSGLGKGITAASIGTILKSRGYSVNIQKLDPYLNVDAGTLNPAEHGECFVTCDGAETDLDLGHYERYLDVELTQKSSVMSGRILRQLINDERAGKYLGKTVQVVPHFTNAIQAAVKEAAEGFDIQIVEIGGTVGDYEAQAFYEAIRELGMSVGRENCLYVQVVYMPYLSASKELKTKPAQNATRDLRAMGILPDVLVARSDKPAPDSVRAKLSMWCGVNIDGIALLPNARTVYEVPLTLERDGISAFILNRLGLENNQPELTEWQAAVDLALADHKKTTKIAIVAKYLDNEDTYMSVIEALKSACWHERVGFSFDWIDAESLSTVAEAKKTLQDYDGIVVPGGFGTRGVEGKINAARYALTAKKPYLGLCLGMQVGCIALARESGIADANTTEIDPKTTNPVIATMIDQYDKLGTGGTMRLGNYPCVLQKGTIAHKLYRVDTIDERHRHRYEFNNSYRETLEAAGLVVSGQSPDGSLVELIEIAGHPFFVASQFHPEFRSRPNRPHPMFAGFIAAITSK
jgi:CTP synthase